MELSTLLRRFLWYAEINTRSDVASERRPSTLGQGDLISQIKEELLQDGVPEKQMLTLDDGSLLVRYGSDRFGAKTCLAAHVDTYFGFPGGAKPIVCRYKGGDVILPRYLEGHEQVVISRKDLEGKQGCTIVTADGTTTLGADDKSGVAILVQTAIDIASGLITPTKPVDFWFCVDEEIGKLDIKVVPEKIVESWQILVTVDSLESHIVDTDCITGWEMIVEFFGNDAHPGVAGDKLKPAHYAAAKLLAQAAEMEPLEVEPLPWNTKGKEGFIYATQVGEMSPSHAKITFSNRAFSIEKLREYEMLIAERAKRFALEFGVKVAFSGAGLQYSGTGVAISQNREIVQPVLDAVAKACGKVEERAVRGGTDGAMVNLTYPSLPCPNIGTGGHNLHGPTEFLVVEEMEQVYNAVRIFLTE